MYQGAKNTSQSGNGKSANPGKKRRRRSTKKKKNPSPLTWVLIAGGTAAVVSGGIAYAVYRKKKKKAPQIPGQTGGGSSLPTDPKVDDWGSPIQDVVVRSGLHRNARFRVYQSESHNVFYGKWQTPTGVGSINSPVLGFAEPWDIDEVQRRVLDAIDR